MNRAEKLADKLINLHMDVKHIYIKMLSEPVAREIAREHAIKTLEVISALDKDGNFTELNKSVLKILKNK